MHYQQSTDIFLLHPGKVYPIMRYVPPSEGQSIDRRKDENRELAGVENLIERSLSASIMTKRTQPAR
jgi:hypothetical protein